MCGGTGVWCTPRPDPYGLSPRVRGNLSCPRNGPRCDGSIPACAGEPRPSSSPRDGTDYAGLSPRVRGNPELRPWFRPWQGSIPACAGEPDAAIQAVRCHEVYPRVCGGTRSGPLSAGSPVGLSPRVRGNRFLEAQGLLSSRSIPACAGEPLAGDVGEPSAFIVRSIPACAGEPAGSLKATVQTIYLRSIPACAGEPAHRHLTAIIPDHGSIPACAGEPLARRGGRRNQDNMGLSPRVRGNPGRVAPIEIQANCGLSPRVRGNRRWHMDDQGTA